MYTLSPILKVINLTPSELQELENGVSRKPRASRIKKAGMVLKMDSLQFKLNNAIDRRNEVQSSKAIQSAIASARAKDRTINKLTKQLQRATLNDDQKAIGLITSSINVLIQ
jgi:hypothetical protein